MDGLRTGEVAEQAGVNIQTLRYYERRGLLSQPTRSNSGYRLYPADTVALLTVIKAAQRLGPPRPSTPQRCAPRLPPRQPSRRPTVPPGAWTACTPPGPPPEPGDAERMAAARAELAARPTAEPWSEPVAQPGAGLPTGWNNDRDR